MLPSNNDNEKIVQYLSLIVSIGIVCIQVPTGYFYVFVLGRPSEVRNQWVPPWLLWAIFTVQAFVFSFNMLSQKMPKDFSPAPFCFWFMIVSCTLN